MSLAKKGAIKLLRKLLDAEWKRQLRDKYARDGYVGTRRERENRIAAVAAAWEILREAEERL